MAAAPLAALLQHLFGQQHPYVAPHQAIDPRQTVGYGPSVSPMVGPPPPLAYAADQGAGGPPVMRPPASVAPRVGIDLTQQPGGSPQLDALAGQDWRTHEAQLLAGLANAPGAQHLPIHHAPLASRLRFAPPLQRLLALLQDAGQHQFIRYD